MQLQAEIINEAKRNSKPDSAQRLILSRLNQLRLSVRERNPWTEGRRKAVKSWAKEKMAAKGNEPFLWGKWEMGFWSMKDLRKEGVRSTCA